MRPPPAKGLEPSRSPVLMRGLPASVHLVRAVFVNRRAGSDLSGVCVLYGSGVTGSGEGHERSAREVVSTSLSASVVLFACDTVCFKIY